MAVKAESAIPPRKPIQLQPRSRSESRTRSPAAGPLSEFFSASAAVRRPATVLALQQRVGNRVVQRQLVRQGTEGEAIQGEDLTAPRFAGDPLLEACFDDRARMTQGHRGPSVEKVQQALLDLGYNLGSSGADGIYGPKTWNAVKQFKANEGLGFVNMGDVGPGTMHRLDALFSSKTQESPPKVADEESVAACPSNDVIVTALIAGPRQRNALVGEPTVGQSPSSHVSIGDAVSRFKSKLNVTTGVSGNNISATGQFFWVQQMHDAIRTELLLMSSDPTALPFVAKARQAREAIDNREFAEATRLIRELDVMAQTTKSPSKPKMLSLLRPDLAGAPATETLLWKALNADPTNAMPSLAPFLSLRTLMQLEAFDKQSCGFAAHKIAERVLQKGGVTGRPNPRAGVFSANLSGVCIRDRRRTPDAFSSTMLGDVVKQSNVASAVAQLKNALDAGQLVHARVLSGVGVGTQPNVPFDLNPPVNVGAPPEEHSLVIIGFDGNKFVFSDPDATVSSSPESGFGFLFFDSANSRLSTAEDDSDLVVSPKGKHRRGDKRYQVLTLSTF